MVVPALIAEIPLRLPTLCQGSTERGQAAGAATGQGNPLLRTALTEAAWAASHTRTYLGNELPPPAARRGKKRAILAVAHSILIIAHSLLKKGSTYEDLVPNYFDERSKEATTRRAVRRLERLGYKVTLELAA